MKQSKKRLTKSRFQSGRQCHKRLWLEVHRPDLAKQAEGVQSRLTAGTRFGEFVRQYFGGVLVDAEPYKAEKALAQTKIFLDLPPTRVPMVFEATFEYEGVLVRVDALQRFPAADRLIEVKSSTKPKDEYFWDCAIQTWVVRNAGRPVEHIGLCLVDSSFVYTREGDYKGLLNIDNYNEQVELLLPQVPAIVSELKSVMVGEQPRIGTGSHCMDPYPCPFFEYCRSAEPAASKYPVEDLRTSALVETLRSAGYSDLRKVPGKLLESRKHKRIAAAARSTSAITSDEFDTVLEAIAYPRHYLDFETIAFVVPRWLGTRPYQQIPFQFSCHIEKANGALEHREYLDLSGNSPVASFADALLEAVGGEGPIIVWNQGFEAGRVRELANMLPKRAKALLALIDRMVDLLPIYREHYCHRDMHGSWSIKAVLPTIAPELSYSNLDVGDGSAAQDAYLEAIDDGTSTKRRNELRKNLLAYCERDTLAMVRLARR